MTFPSQSRGQLELYFQKVFTHRAVVVTAAMAQSIPQRLGLTTQAIENAHHQAMWEASVASRAADLAEDRWWGGAQGRRRGMRECRRMIRYYLEVVEPKLDAFAASLREDIV